MCFLLPGATVINQGSVQLNHVQLEQVQHSERRRRLWQLIQYLNKRYMHKYAENLIVMG